jgi:excisionase family DNA binding protein
MKLLDARQAATLLGVTQGRIYRLAAANLLPHVRLGRRLLVEETQLQEFVAKGGRAYPGGWRCQPTVERTS